MTDLIYVLVATAATLLILFAGYFISHLQSKVARLEHAQSELVRRGVLNNEKLHQYLKLLNGILVSHPIPSVILDVRDGAVVAESEALAKEIQAMSSVRISEPAFSFCFLGEDQYPCFLPVLRNLLTEQQLKPGIYSDYFSLATRESGQNSDAKEVVARVSVQEPLAYVEFEFPDRVTGKEYQADTDNRILRSILNEERLDRAFERAATLFHKPLGKELLCSVSVVDSDIRSLKLVWHKGMEGVIKSIITRVPIVFGHTPPATATILEKTVMAGPGVEASSEIEPIHLPEQIHAWHSHPITSMDGKVLGTLDLIALNDSVHFPGEECVANFQFIASVILERRHALDTIVRQARVDQLVKEVGQRLLTPQGNSRFEVLSSCLLFLQTASELSKGKIGLVYECPDNRIEFIGDFFATESRRDQEQELQALAIRDVFKKGYEAWGAESECGMDVTVIEPGSYWAQKITQVFPVSEEMKSVSLILCPIILNDALAGALIFGSETDCNEAQQSLLTMITADITNYLIREELLEKLQSQANHDPLTGLYNRGCIEERLKAEIERSRRYKNDLSVVLFDIDHFKSINDSFGHDVGDEVLKSVASRFSLH